MEIRTAIDANTKNKYTKTIDQVNTEVLFNSILSSFEKMIELIELLNKEKTDWKKEISAAQINKCLSACDGIFEELDGIDLTREKIEGLRNRKENTKKELREII